MSVASQIIDLSARIQDAYVALSAKGATMPETKNSYNLSSTILTVQTAKTEQSKTVTPTAAGFTVSPDSGNVLTSVVVNGDGDLVAGNIKKDVNIFGVTGTYEGSGGGGDIVFGMSKQYVNVNDNPDSGAIKIYVDGQSVWDGGGTGFCIKNPTSIQFTSDYWSDNPWLRLKYADGTTQDINSGTTITNLTQSVVVQEYHGFSCLDGSTMILMKNRKEKAIADIKVGDEVACINPKTGEADYDVVKYCDSDEEKWHDEKDVWTFDDGTELTTIHPHEFYNVQHGKFMYIADFKIGDKVLKSNKATTRLVGHKNIKEKVRHFTLFTEKYNNYFANGILTGNRHSTALKILEK